jgi:2'-5' RNA ligase
VFVGVELDDTQRALCATASADLARRLGALRRFDARWITSENLHVTLWFLGELEEEASERVAETLRAPWTVESFQMTIRGGGAFPASGPPRIIWFGLSEGAETLGRAYTELADRFAPLGYEPERRSYHPHLTVGRIKQADRVSSRKARDLLREFPVNGGSQYVTALTLFRSHLSPRGSRYEALLRVPLKAC